MSASKIQTTKIRRELVYGAATSRELAIGCHMSLRNVQVGLWVLTKRGDVRVIGQIANNGRGRGAARSLKLYELTQQGLFNAAEKKTA